MAVTYEGDGGVFNLSQTFNQGSRLCRPILDEQGHIKTGIRHKIITFYRCGVLTYVLIL